MPAVPLVADRYLAERGSYIDLATGCPVLLRVRAARSLSHQVEWAERCAILSTLRHPALHPLIDYGAADATSTFEAYQRLGPLAVPRHAARLAAHAARFLDAHGLALDGDVPAAARREIRESANGVRRACGIVIQPRRALGEAVAVLEGGRPSGVEPVCIAGAEGSGLRTLRIAIAHAARSRGYVPVEIEALARRAHLTAALAGRHLCLFGMADSPAAGPLLAALLARLAIESARRHACFIFYRHQAPPCALVLDDLGVAAMTRMVFIDPERGPSPADLFAAARRAGGRPGRFLAALGAAGFDSGSTEPLAVHESPVPYVVERGGPLLRGRPGPPRRIGLAAARAPARAAQLTGRGRHGAAQRLLARAVRVLEARGETRMAAECLLQAAWVARARGDGVAAATACARARAVAADPSSQVAAAIAQGVCWTDEARLPEAEAALRTTMTAAAALSNRDLGAHCALALARALVWRGGADDALSVLQPLLRSPSGPAAAVEGRILAARAHLLRDELAEAIRLARQALDAADASPDPRLGAGAHRTMAAAMTRAGDLTAVRTHVAAGLRAASAAHLPLHALKLRATLLEALRHHRHPDAPRLDAVLARALARRRVPPLLRIQIARAAGRDVPPALSACSAPWPQPSMRNALEDLLTVAHGAPDDASAMEAIGEAVSERLRCASVQVMAADSRAICHTGRPWREPATAASQAMAAASAVLPQASRQPAEAAGPVQYGGQVIGAIACRWPAGHTPDVDRTAGLLRAASLALAPHLRAVLDTVVPEPPAAAWSDLLGESQAAVALRAAVQRAARAPFPVLIEGESGSGKELVARAVHRLGSRRDRRFCALNCAAITDELVEAELFGHARGAFTGAAGERAGLFEEADGGTLFLDEVGELSARAQAKLLRVLQDGEVRRVGENLPRKVDVRIVAATNRRLPGEVEAGRFRADLRFRLDVIRIAVPPLRERGPDIPLLATHFWRQATARLGCRATLSPDALAALARYDWPGNVRELQNVVAWLAVHAPPRGRVGAALLPAHLASAPLATGTFEAAREEFERRFVRAALATAGGQRGRAARALGVSRQGLAKMMRRLGLEEGKR